MDDQKEWLRRRRTSLLVGIALISSILLVPSPARADACGADESQGDGFAKDPALTYLSWGVSANITVRPVQNLVAEG